MTADSRALLRPSDTVFVAGSRGMAGQAISRALSRRGYDRQLLVGRDQLDLLDGGAVERWFAQQRPDVVVLAAARVGGIHANRSYPADFLLENLKIEQNVIEAAWRYGVRRLLFLGSSCIYPKYAEQPIREEALLSGPLEPTNAWYAIAKIAGIKLCDALRLQYGFDAISLMPTNLYGPGDNYHATHSHVLPALIRRFHEAAVAADPVVRCWGSGRPLREFLHADDLGEACVFALEHWDPTAPDAPKDDDGQPLGLLNVGSGEETSIAELAGLVAQATGYRGEIQWDPSQPDGTPRKLLDCSRLAQLGWCARIPLRTGIEATVQLFRQQLQAQQVRL
ncbi:GDP-L-fucose synthase [Synechococcus sp. HK05]|uniref:GDP-L-fucose synthase family protein n=1 Tax=Synechococcus sp. HK05 TaxID=2725975 RepID=UPI001C38C602|nr:GDP-L-fucose synthase [Synechococcus sp. HK05]MBV2350327.1 GDP-L-fucose synthase [Synechococcus sp. HK05]